MTSTYILKTRVFRYLINIKQNSVISNTSNKVYLFNSIHINKCYSTMANILKPPSHVRGITLLDKSLFEKEIKVPALIVKEVTISNLIPALKQFLLKIDNFKPIETIEEETTIYLNPLKWNISTSDAKEVLQSLSLDENNLHLLTKTLKYENYSAEDLFRSILPEDKEGMSSFTKIGHIIHVNLREHLLPYKNVIGQILFEKIPGCRTVVNKIDMIDNTYRNFQMELLYGDNDMITTLKENQCTFKFDFSTVYWNSRLCTEHERIVKLLKPDDVLFDVFAGVGPFSIPCARKKCTVYANDLNPESYKWLNENIKINKINAKCIQIQTYNKDGRDFILNEIKELLPKYIAEKSVYITMNLPALAVTFLDSFKNLFKDDELPESIIEPTVFVYCFAKSKTGDDYEEIAKQLVTENIGLDITDKIVNVFKVRTVSSLKEMMRVSFKLNRDILVGGIRKKRKIEDSEESNNKKCMF